ncbi:MAG: hypothetical protein DRM99_04440 [Thermoplasmata archaeon]|nr:MAG: hypothetical protein DRM99_04440 [Thermoplasmata archaeon]
MPNQRLFEELWSYRKKVYYIVLGIIKDPIEAEDLTQETYIRVLNASDNFRNESNPTTWLYRIAKNTAKDYYKKRKTILYENLNVPKFSTNGLEKKAILGVVIKRLMNKVEGLLDSGSALKLRAEGLSYKEIATQLNMPTGTISSRIHRVREFLKPEKQSLESLIE